MRRRLSFLLLFAVSAGLLLTPIFQTFIREAVVIPLLYLVWIGRFVLSAIPYTVLWGCYVALLLLIMGVSLLAKRQKKRKPSQPQPDHEDRVAGLAKLIEQAEQDDYFKWRLAQQLQKLSLDTMAYHSGQPIGEIRQQLRQGTLDIPPELQAYFEAGLKPLGSVVTPQKLFATKHSPTALDLDPVEVAQFLESFYKTQSDHSHEKSRASR